MVVPFAEYNDNARSTNDLVAETSFTAAPLEFRNSGDVVAFIRNGSASPITATAKSRRNRFGRGGAGDEDNDEAITIAAGDIGFFAFLNPAAFNDERGMALITLSSHASTSFGVARIR